MISWNWNRWFGRWCIVHYLCRETNKLSAAKKEKKLGLTYMPYFWSDWKEKNVGKLSIIAHTIPGS